MAKLIYSAIASLDGYVEDMSGNFEWAAPDKEVFAFVNDLERPVGTYLYGRRMYEAIAAGLVDECHLFVCPIVVGGGKSALPNDVRVQLELLEEHRFRSGVVHLGYGVRA